MVFKNLQHVAAKKKPLKVEIARHVMIHLSAQQA
jgi:hypothetical protein